MVCIIQARTGSTRFPRKVLERIDNCTVLSLVIKRTARSDFFKKSNIIVATTGKKEDDPIANIAGNEGVKVFRGSENDVLDRYYQAAKNNSAEVILRITSDCPLIDHQIIDRVTKVFLAGKGIDYCSNRLSLSYPEGLDTEIFSFVSLEKAWRRASRPYDREHVTPYLYTGKRFKTMNVSFDMDLSYLHLSLDYREDLDFLREIYKRMTGKGFKFVLKDILRLLRQEPGILRINQAGEAYPRFLRYIRRGKAG
jgi:spore coat polysaccharide biosynthesis protein SpsF